MAKKSQRALTALEAIAAKILVLRGHRVMLDRDRFPEDFMFELSLKEGKTVMAIRSQNVILKRGAHLKYSPRVFTEHGVVMLANVLKSDLAVRASIRVVRAFVHLRQLLAANEDFARKMEALERKVGKHDQELKEVLNILRSLLEPPPLPPKRSIGFIAPVSGKG